MIALKALIYLSYVCIFLTWNDAGGNAVPARSEVNAAENNHHKGSQH